MRVLIASLMIACGGGGEADEAVTAQTLLPEALLASSWQMQVASQADLDKLAGMPSWQAYFQRDYSTALSQFGNTAGGARMHAELAGIYRQAALIQARAI